MNIYNRIFKKKLGNSVIEGKEITPFVLYKYRDWNNEYHKRAITNNEIYFSSPSYFNDPFDCKLPKNFTQLNTEEKKKNYAKQFIYENYKNISEAEKHEKFIKIITELQDINKYQKEYEERYNKLHDERIGILSLTNRWDSILMWSHYSNFHKGFCLGYNFEHLNNQFFGKHKKVNYSKEIPNLSLKANIDLDDLNMPFHKNLDWEYEQEYRFMHLFPNPNVARKISLSDEFIKEINLGLMISEEHKEEIIKIASEKKWDIYQVIKVPFKFEITRIKL